MRRLPLRSVESMTSPNGPDGIEAIELTKRHGGKTVVDGLTFTVRPGTVTGFLGPGAPPRRWLWGRGRKIHHPAHAPRPGRT
ncbi:hypothetical protein GCM10010446_51420 [Streptomyces enissocaesilis]|uniref:Uncharacterized protein n=1 Tax=Streptomyces enissocaesilis TaxID=332589 RepID=A0ABP6K3S4_9ACTN